MLRSDNVVYTFTTDIVAFMKILSFVPVTARMGGIGCAQAATTEVGTLTGPTKDMTAGLYVCR